MTVALLLVDLQHDFIDRPGLLPALEDLSPPLESVLQYARDRGLPVIHIHTLVSSTGEDRMPHWKALDIRQCIAGSVGAEPPPQFAALANETIIGKQFFSGFSNPMLETRLQELGTEELWITGLYTHSCVRSTAMDAYQRGYRVTLVEDCLGSTDPLHARLSLDYLEGRAATVARSAELTRSETTSLTHQSPADPSKTVVSLAPDSAARINAIALRADAASAAWQETTIVQRRSCLRDFRDRLDAATPQLAALMASDLGKPYPAAIEEMKRAIGHIDAALDLEPELAIGPGVGVIYEPHGVVAIVTPWNNPVAIAVGKLCAALLLGNTVVWKPAYQANNISCRILELARTVGLPEGVLQIVNGGPAEVATLARAPCINAVSVTGPEQAGQAIAPICLAAGKPLQAELGGNNALLVMGDADIPRLAPCWARLAFAFAGQRCTAVRRFVVERSILDSFEEHMRLAIADLEPRQPALETCEVGPLISARHKERVSSAVQSALQRGARRVCVAAGDCVDAPGHYYPPTLLADLPPHDELVQEELFGPVAIVQAADDFEHGLTLVNGVRQGLLAALATRRDALFKEFRAACETGIVADGQGLPIHPAAPFGGRKASQFGPPEHGVWDRQFFGRVKACYGSTTG